MSIKDINETYQDYIESDKFKAFLYTPANIFVGVLDLMNPTLSLRKDGFDMLDFQLSAKVFDLATLSLEDNPVLDYTLDGYYIVFDFGDLTGSNKQQRRFVIKNRNSALQDEQATFSYTAISAEYELQKLPIINWPGIQVKEYKDISNVIQAVEQVSGVANPTLLDGSTTGYNPITLRHTPKNSKIIVSRIHTTYGIEIPLIETKVSSTELTKMAEGDYYYDSVNNQVIVWVPAHISLPVDDIGTVNFNNPVDSYQYYIYYETTDTIDEENDIIEGEFEKAYFYNTDGLTINQIIDDLFQNLTSEDTNLRFFLQWTYDSNNSITYDEVRSGINFSSTNVYDMLKALGSNYQVYIDFDTINRKIIIRNRNFGTNNGLRFEYGKYLTGVTQEYNTDEVINYVQGQDANSVGFADVSWSGDNYIENYDYYLDGVTWDPTNGLQDTSRWISGELALVLAKIKYWQGQYNDEVWGNDSGKEGIANIIFRLQEELVNLEFEIEEIDSLISYRQSLIDIYDGESLAQKVLLDKGVQKVSSTGITNLVPGQTYQVDINLSSSESSPTNSLSNQIINASNPVTFKSFYIDATDFNEVFAFTDKIQRFEIVTRARVTFRNNGTQVFTKTLTAFDLNKEIALPKTVTATTFDIEFSLLGVESPVFQSNANFTINYLSFFEEDNLQTFYSFDTYKDYQTSYRLNLEMQRNELQARYNRINYGLAVSYDATQVTNESNVYSPDIDNNIEIGIAQLELRLNEIRKNTAIDHSALNTEVLNELKSIRKGAIYQNPDIKNSKTLFVAARNFLEEKIYPMITIGISSVSILQTYEGYEDWDKVRIGEKVDIYVEELGIDIEAEIQELTMNFQDYSTSIKISTVQNYDKSFGKIFANTFLLAARTSQNEVIPNQDRNRTVASVVQENSGLFKGFSKNGQLSIVSNDPFESIIEERLGGSSESSYKVLPPEPAQVEIPKQELPVKYIDLPQNTVTDKKPSYYIDNKIVGKASLAGGGLIIKDNEDDVRIKLNAVDGFVGYKTESGVTTESFKIDLDGNATFAGELQAASGTFAGALSAATGTFAGTLSVGVDTTAIDGNYDAAGSASAALVSANLYTDGEITTLQTALQNQIDGAIETYFDGVPLPITTTSNGTTLPVSGSEGDTFYDTDDNLYYTFTQGSWVGGGNSSIDGAVPWPTNDVSFYNAHKGDLYYDNTTGYAYRFTKITTSNPDVVGNYKWVQISDSAATAALAAASTAKATADGKMTYFTASTLTAVNGLNAQAGDILIPSVDITDGATEPTTLYFENTVYTYTLISTGPDVFEWLPEEKKAGTVGGWTIASDQIKSNNDKIILDNTNSTITVGSGTGIVTLNGAATGTSAVVNHANFQLNADGSASFSGGLSAATGTFAGSLSAATGSFGAVTVDSAGSLTVGNIVINNNGIVGTDGTDPKFNLSASTGSLTITGGLTAANADSTTFTNTNVSINQGASPGYDNAGIFLGVIDDTGTLAERFSIKDANDNNFLKWDGSALNIKGDLNLSTTYFNYGFLNQPGTPGSNFIVSNISYDGDNPIGVVGTEGDFGIDGFIEMSTGSSIIVDAVDNTWLDLGTTYTGISQILEGSHETTSANGLTVGLVYFFNDDQRYYEVIGGGTSTPYIVLSIENSTTTDTTYNIPLIVSGSSYRMPNFQIAHEYTASSGNFVRFTIAHGWAAGTAFTNKDLKLTVSEDNSISNLFDVVLAATGTTSVVTSINGQVGDVQIATGGSVNSVGLSLPDIFTITEGGSTSPIIESGTLTATLTTQGPNKVFVGPSSGETNATPTFRSLVAADLPDAYVSATGTQTQKTFLGAPNGENGVPTFRQIDYSDLTGTAPSAFNGGTIENDLTISNTTPTLNFVDTSSQIDDFDISVNTNRFTINNTTTDNDLMTITQNGKVGIGTISPLNKLEVRHTGVDGDNGILITKVDSAITAGEYLGGIGFDATDGNAPSSVLEASAYIAAYASEDHATTDKGGQLAFGLASIDQDDDTVSIEKMRLRDTGLEVFGNLTSAGGFMSDDLYLLYDGPTSGQDQDYDSHGIIFQIWDHSNEVGSQTELRELKVNTSGTLTFNGTAVSLAGHPHSEYVAVTGDTMTDDLTFEKTGETNVGSHGIIFQGHNALFDPADYSKKLDMAISGDLRFDGNILATQSYVTSRGYITGYTVTSSDVTTALGYTPLSTTGKAADSEKLDNIDSGSFLRSDEDDTMSGDLTLSDAALAYSGQSGVAVPVPQGGLYSTTTSTETGYLKITLPVSWTNTMLSLYVDIYEYETDETFTVQLAGYNYSPSSAWINTTANLVSSSTGRQFNVRFGHDGSKCAIYIGESNSGWTYPQVRVRDFLGGYSGATVANWADGWAVGFTTTLGTITSTQVLESEVSYADSSGNSASLGGVLAANYLRSDVDDVANGIITFQNGMRVGTGTHSTDGRASITFGEGAPTTTDSMYIEYDGENLSGDANAIIIGSNKEGVGDVFRLTYGGDVGIGTTAPGTKLDVTGNIRATTDMYVGNAIYHDGDTNTYTQFHAADQWRVVTGGSERLEVNDSAVTVVGNLSVGGTITANGLTLSNDNVANVNQLSINDPGEGILWLGTTNINQYIIDTASDNIMNFENLAEMQIDGSRVWNSGNDGSGSGLDADTTDGKHIWVGTLSSYNAITTKDANTLYFIT